MPKPSLIARHTGMPPGGMDHGGMDHGDMDMGGDSCKMSMLLNADYKNVCVLTSQWKIKSIFGLILSMFLIAGLSAGYELLKNWIDKWEARFTMNGGSVAKTNGQIKSYRLKSSLLYGITVFYSFLIMLIFMTFNLWLMGAVALGAAVGQYLFRSTTISNGAASTNSLACH